VGNNARFPASSACQQQKRALYVRDSFALLRI
jgi:hypothetical protein